MRIISCLDIKNNLVVKGIKFKNLKILNNPIYLTKKYEKEKINEIVLLDITSNYTKKSLSNKLLKKISKNINIPLSVGGGNNNKEKIKKKFKLGSDKIIINSILYKNIFILKDISNLYGSQAISISIDFKKKKNFFTYKNSGFSNTKFLLIDWIIITKKLGVGDIIVTSIDNDGKCLGYDYKSSYILKKIFNIKIIISGGFGSFNDYFYIYKNFLIKDFIIASLFHKKIISPLYFKKYLKIL